ncbi:hypothetical protein [Candidatus Foliamicus sp.]
MKRTGCAFAGALTAVFLSSTAPAAPPADPLSGTRLEWPHGEDRDQLGAAMARYGLSSASALAREITRQVIATQRQDEQFENAPAALRHQLPAATGQGRNFSPTAGAGESAQSNDRQAYGELMTWLRGALRKLARLLTLS